jgi:adenylyltransferase/sulfurtransferase
LGVVGASAGTIGALQAVEALKVLLGIGQPLTDRVLLWEGLTMQFDTVQVARNAACPACGD